MKTPLWLKEEIAAFGARILNEEITEEQAVQQIRLQSARDYPDHVYAVYDEYIGKALRAWMTKRAAADMAGLDSAQLVLLPGLPLVLEISPGRFAAQAVMTKRDWEAARRQARTKADNATGYADRIDAAYDLVVPLLTTDDMTTADVLPELTGQLHLERTA
ncbi:hypothetical protein [Thermoactinospora rubra]|uniref:hypothetical protein n=1 Tax=Thermoactinospora rubra TaxID=1088767 RepID=UPI000A110BD3|nr:hypothetical protein [Thermoactinospora rubra]